MIDRVFSKAAVPAHLQEFFVSAQRGAEATPDEFVAALVGDFRAVRRVLRDDGTVWLNLGSSYNGNPGGPQGEQQGALDFGAAA